MSGQRGRPKDQLLDECTMEYLDEHDPTDYVVEVQTLQGPEGPGKTWDGTWWALWAVEDNGHRVCLQEWRSRTTASRALTEVRRVHDLLTIPEEATA